MLTIEPMFNESFNVEFIEYYISIALLAGRKDNDLEVFTHFFEKTKSIRSDGYVAFLALFYFDLNLAIPFAFKVIMDQCFIQINHENFFGAISRIARQVQGSISFWGTKTIRRQYLMSFVNMLISPFIDTHDSSCNMANIIKL